MSFTAQAQYDSMEPASFTPRQGTAVEKLYDQMLKSVLTEAVSYVQHDYFSEITVDIDNDSPEWATARDRVQEHLEKVLA